MSESNMNHQFVHPFDVKRFEINSLVDVLKEFARLRDVDQEKLEGVTKQLAYVLSLNDAVDQSIIIGITDAAGTIIYANELFCKISKYEKHELIGNNHRILKSGYHSKSFFRELWRTISSGEQWEGEIKNKAKDGSYYWVKTSIVPVLTSTGKPYMYISIRTDITEGKLAQEQLYIGLQEEYRHTVKALDHMVFKVRKNHKGKMYFSLFEGKLAEKLGFANENIYNKSPIDIINHKEDMEYVMSQFNKAFQGEHTSYKRKIAGKTLFISLSPIIRNGKVIEVVGNGSDITELDKAHEMINHMAYHDIITHLPNQRLFDKDLEKQLNQAKLNKAAFGILCLRINGLTKVNESFGHEVGEQLLCSQANILNDSVKKYGVFYRSEGSHFLILTKLIENLDKLEQLALIIQKEVEKPKQIQNHELRLSCNIGASSYPDSGQNSQQLVKNAYIALNYARFREGSHYKYYTRDVHQYYQETQLLENALLSAIEKNQLTLYYQPKIDLSDNKLIGMEALIRWYLPSEGFISPATFIPIAEETGIILALGEWVLKEATRQCKEWINKGYRPLKIAVNISPHELQHSQFLHKLQAVLKETNIDPSYLEIEITENSIMQDTNESIEIIEQLREIGVTVAIDDFGTGYSSLSYLKKFPVNTLKIDQTFIRDLLKSQSDTQLVLAMINIAHIFGLTVVAEGVETAEIANFLKKCQCEQVQGYFYSKPLPPEEFEQRFLMNQPINR